MGRNVKPGISFYRIDSGHILNKKIRLLCNEFDSDGYYIWSCVLDYAYGKWGYYFDMNDKDELDLFASEYCKKKLTLVKEVITGCIRRGLFDKTVFDLSGILTSTMMQEVFIYATAERRRQGSIFEMRSDWLKIDFGEGIPVKIKIVHANNNLDHVKNPQTKQDKTKTETRQEVRAQIAPTDPEKKNKKFIPPTVDEVKNYFLLMIGNPKNPGSWPADKCKNEASTFVDHYTANGWVQNRGKPVKDWQAASRNWIRNALKGTFERDVPAIKQDAAPRPKEVHETRDKIQMEINYLFERFLEDQITVISITAMHYNHLKNSGHLKFSDQEKETMRNVAIDHLALNSLGGDEDNILKFMKKFAVLEYFKKLKSEKLATAE